MVDNSSIIDSSPDFLSNNMPEEKKDGNDSKIEYSEVETSAIEDTSKSEKKKYNDWPVREIKEPHDNDVLYGRGGM
jgi:hypothetical protein